MILVVVVLIAGGSYLTANTAAKPLRKGEILALVAGAMIPENIAYDIRSRGINFAHD